MHITELDGRLFARMVRGGAARLENNRVTVNELNVFPIPDGDTGDNMFMTMDSGAEAADKDDENAIGAASGRIARGMLLGARGNSGVILSRIFAGISKGLEGLEKADLNSFACALEKGVEEAYKAVQTPVEGTILTVNADAVRFANSRIGEGEGFEGYFEDLVKELRASLDRTPELLAVLKEAGVVDSGGAGLVFIAEGMQDALFGREGEHAPIKEKQRQSVDISTFTEDSELEFGYCTEFLLRLQTKKVGKVSDFDEKPLFDWLEKNGESLVAFRDGSIIRVHVHTMRPEEVLAHCHEYGEFLTLKIENMLLQHNETSIRNNYKPAKPMKKYGIVAVAAGEGIKDTFIKLGADAVVDGGQSMNPSAESFLEAFSDVNAENILVFPNNSNIIMTAEQAAQLASGVSVRVIPSRSIGECYAALSLLDTSSGDPELIEKNCIDIMGSIATGAVSRAVRDSECGGVSVKKGEFIGFSNGKILAGSPCAQETVIKLADSLMADDFGILMLVCGKDSVFEEAKAAVEALKKAHPMTEVILLDGGQPVYDYIIILE